MCVTDWLTHKEASQINKRLCFTFFSPLFRVSVLNSGNVNAQPGTVSCGKAFFISRNSILWCGHFILIE